MRNNPFQPRHTVSLVVSIAWTVKLWRVCSSLTWIHKIEFPSIRFNLSSFLLHCLLSFHPTWSFPFKPKQEIPLWTKNFNFRFICCQGQGKLWQTEEKKLNFLDKIRCSLAQWFGSQLVLWLQVLSLTTRLRKRVNCNKVNFAYNCTQKDCRIVYSILNWFTMKRMNKTTIKG